MIIYTISNIIKEYSLIAYRAEFMYQTVYFVRVSKNNLLGLWPKPILDGLLSEQVWLT